MNFDTIADLLDAHLPRIEGDERALGLAAYRRLAATGMAAPVGALADEAGLGAPRVDELLAGATLRSLVVRDEEGAVIGFGGLAVRPMHHRLRIDGRELYTWCAWDSLFIPPLLAKRADVFSPDPHGGEAVRLTVGPDGIEAADPASTVLSFVVPERDDFSGDVHRTMASFCHFVFLFASPDSARAWAHGKDRVALLTLDEGFRLGQLLNRTRWGLGQR